MMLTTIALSFLALRQEEVINGLCRVMQRTRGDAESKTK